MKRLAIILIALLSTKLSLLAADCHGAAALIANKIDDGHASIHIDAVMQCDDGKSLEFRSREAVITPDMPKEIVAHLLVAMAQETVDYFDAAGIPSDVKDLIEHLKIRTDELTLPPNTYRLKYAPPFPMRPYPPTYSYDEEYLWP